MRHINIKNDTHAGSTEQKNLPYKKPPITHRTALAALPPEAVWGPIQAIRRVHDRQFYRWMPHINLVYPFMPQTGFATVLPFFLETCARMPAFPVRLQTIRHFTHAAGRATLWLAPEPGAALQELQSHLQAVVPAYDDLRRFPGGFTPHLSIGQANSPAELQRLLPELQAAWKPLEFTLTAVAVLHREADQPFHVAHWLPLGRQGPAATEALQGP